MEIAFLLVAIAATVLAVTAISERVEVPAPLTLVVVGVAASYVPGVPELRLEPEVVLLGLLPPLLYSAAVNTSLVDFNANRRPILLLSVGLVAFTTFGVAAVIRMVIPEVEWPLALAIGAADRIQRLVRRQVEVLDTFRSVGQDLGGLDRSDIDERGRAKGREGFAGQGPAVLGAGRHRTTSFD